MATKTKQTRKKETVEAKKSTEEISEKDVFLSKNRADRIEYVFHKWAEYAKSTDSVYFDSKIGGLNRFTVNIVYLNELLDLLKKGQIEDYYLYARMSVLCARLSEYLLEEKFLAEDKQEPPKE